jgi:hypothetical protein
LSTCVLATAAGAAPPPDRAAVPAADRNPTMGDVRDLYEQGDYPRLLQQVSRALAVRGQAAKDYDRYDLLVLKGEGHLNLKNPSASAEAFDEAAKYAADEQAAALARSMAELVRRTKGQPYTPPAKKGQPPPAPIDVLDRKQRPAAFAGLYDEYEAKVRAAVKTASASTQLPPMLDAFRMLYDLRWLELAVTSGDARTVELAEPLTVRARSVMARAVSQMSKTVDDVKEATLRAYDAGLLRSGGVTRDNKAVLRQLAADCDRITGVAVDLKKVFPADQADALRTLGDDAAEVAAYARNVLGIHWDDAGMTYDDGAGQGGYVPANREPGTNFVQRPTRGRPGQAAPPNRGVGTGGIR